MASRSKSVATWSWLSIPRLSQGVIMSMKQVISDINVSEMCILPSWLLISCQASYLVYSQERDRENGFKIKISGHMKLTIHPKTVPRCYHVHETSHQWYQSVWDVYLTKLTFDQLPGLLLSIFPRERQREWLQDQNQWPHEVDYPSQDCPKMLSCPWNKSSVISMCLGCVSYQVDFWSAARPPT